jgi:hypothetical protein
LLETENKKFEADKRFYAQTVEGLLCVLRNATYHINKEAIDQEKALVKNKFTPHTKAYRIAPCSTKDPNHDNMP